MIKRIVTALIAVTLAGGVATISTESATAAPKPQATERAVPVPPKWDPTKDKLQPPKFRPKGHPDVEGQVGTFAACSPPCYKYAGARRAQTGITSVSADLRMAIPSVDSVDYHSLAELTLENGNMIIEVGWNRDRSLYGETYPAIDTHLFVSAWYDNGSTRVGCGYNGGCGYTDYSGNATNAGAIVSAQNGNLKQFQIVLSSGRWWLWYDTNWLGSYPTDLGHSQVFTTGVLTQGFGEVGAAHDPTCTDMGNSWIANAANTYPTSGAEVSSLNTSTGGGYSNVSWDSTVITDATHWNAVLPSGTTGKVLYGGPGYSPNPGACP